MKTTKQYHRTLECLKYDTSFDIQELKDFRFLLDNVECSKETHYHRLNEWSEPLHLFIREKMYKHGFENGNVEENNKKPNARFWFEVYQIIDAIIYSPNLKTQVGLHHSSAFERNEALKVEIDYIITQKDV